METSLSAVKCDLARQVAWMAEEDEKAREDT